MGFSKLIEARHERVEGLYRANISRTRVSDLALSRHSLGIGSRGPTPRGAGSRLVFFSLRSRLSLLSRDSRPRESTVDSHQEADQN